MQQKLQLVKQVIIQTLKNIVEIKLIKEVKVGVLDKSYIELNDDNGSNSESQSLDFQILIFLFNNKLFQVNIKLRHRMYIYPKLTDTSFYLYMTTSLGK